MFRRACDPLAFTRPHALAWCCAVALAPAWPAYAQGASLADKARESGCVGKPVAISASLYKCATASGAESFFNVPDGSGNGGGGGGATSAPRRVDGKPTSTPSPAGFPRVDAETQKGRDDLRRKVLNDELGTEEKALADARAAYDNGAPIPLPEEKADAEKYRQRIARLREAVQLHQRNVDMLRKEIATTR